MKMVFVASIIRRKLCIIYAWFYYFLQTSFFTKNYLLIAAINLTTLVHFMLVLFDLYSHLADRYLEIWSQVNQKGFYPTLDYYVYDQSSTQMTHVWLKWPFSGNVTFRHAKVAKFCRIYSVFPLSKFWKFQKEKELEKNVCSGETRREGKDFQKERGNPIFQVEFRDRKWQKEGVLEKI